MKEKEKVKRMNLAELRDLLNSIPKKFEEALKSSYVRHMMGCDTSETEMGVVVDTLTFENPFDFLDLKQIEEINKRFIHFISLDFIKIKLAIAENEFGKDYYNEEFREEYLTE